MGLLPADVAVASSSAKHGITTPAVPRNKRIPFTRQTPKRGPSPKPFKHFDPSGHAKLPAPGSATVVLPVTAAGAGLSAKATQERAGKTPVLLGAVAGTQAPSAALTTTQRVRVTTLDQKSALAAGIHGLLFTLQRTSPGSGKIALRVDDSSFRYAFGGDFASRLHLVELPACVLTTPKLARCQVQTPVRTASGTPLAAHVSVPGPAATTHAASRSMATATSPLVVMAATSDASGSAGDYSATKLSPGGSWSTSGNTGSFTYDYPIAVPPPVGGAAPKVEMSYDSSSQDSLTEGTNNQSSWLGDGWNSTDNYIERTYKSCDEVSSSGAPKNDGDECWAGQILTLSLNGKSTEIVYDDSTKTFRPVDDDSTTKIEYLTGASNGTTNGEYFKVTEGGVQSFFGLNRLPGWSSGKDETNSVWTEPVYHAHDDVSACPDSTTFADTACTLGYRFNLDYTVDTHGNATAWYYSPETGYYGADMKDTAVPYTRGGTLARIDYGMTSSTIYSGTAPEQVVFHTTERCIAGTPAGNTCADSQFTTANASYWPDVPVDLNCTKAASCTNHGPSFWSRERLTSIVTQIQTGGATQQVDKYTFTQSFPDGGDHAPTLWLDSIQHTGLDTLGGASGSTSTPALSFDPPLQLPNRVGTIPQMPLMYHDRIQTVTSETGAQTTVAYNRPNCSAAPASDPNDPTDAAAQSFASTNTLSCFPVYWTPYGQPSPWMDWFYKYTVHSVVTTDTHNAYQDGSEPKLETDYDYKGDPGWHYDDNEVVKAKNRTWGQFRGYPEVDVTTGDPDVFHVTNGAQVHDQKTLTKTYYFLGMNGDTLPGGKTRSAPALTSQDGATTVADDDALAGQTFETDTYTAAGGTIDKADVTVPAIIGPTASRSRSGLPALTAQMVRTAKNLTREAVSYGWRKTETDTFYNTTKGTSTTGMPVQVDDRGETADSDNIAKCTYTRYVTGSADTLVLPAETIKTAQDCSSPGATPSGTLISDDRTSYDHNAFVYDGEGRQNPALPKTGDATLVQQASAASGPTATSFLDQTATYYDSYGRVTRVVRTPNSTSPDGKSLAQSVYTTYTPASGAPPTGTTMVTQVTPGVDCSTTTTSSKDCRLASNTLDPARAVPTAKTDAAGLLTSLTYDALGRGTAVWLPNESKAAGAPANTTYTYKVSQQPPVVTTNTLLDDGSYKTSETLYDAMLRPLQTQETAENSTTTVSDTQYDSHGWTVITNNAYSIQASPSTTLADPSKVTMSDTTVTDHDGMGRADLATEEHNYAKTWATTTAYAGDKTTVLPPKGGVTTTTVVNARGQTTELDQYTAAPTLSGTAADGYTVSGGTTSPTTYGYNVAGQQNQVTGPDKSQWTDDYDLLGRKKAHHDPDAGKTDFGYDDAGNLTSTTDAKQVELDYTYDLLGRKLTASDKAKSDFLFASWAYDTLRIGQPTSSTRYVQGTTGGYTVSATGYTTLGKPTGTKITLPASEAPLPTTYTTSYTYSINDQLLRSQADPRTQGLTSETINYGHDTLGNPTTSGSSGFAYITGTTYTDYAAPSLVTYGATTNPATATYSYDDQTLRPTERVIQRTQTPGPTVDDAKYTYDASGNPTSTTDQQSETGNTVTDQQCYSYDALDRLTDAWTANDNCAANPPTTSTLTTAPGSYWQTFNYDAIGNRHQSIDHAIGSTGTTTTTYNDSCTSSCNSTGTQPHTLTSTTGGTNPTAFGYDEDGNLHTRTPTTGPGQTLTWDDEGNLAKVDAGGSSPTATTYLYDADGNQLIRRDPGQTTLFAGDTEIVVNTSVTPNVLLGAVRTYTHGGAGSPVAVWSSLTGGGRKYLFSDANGTATLSMDSTTQQVARQQYTPFGQPRTGANISTWPDTTHGYLGKPQDTSTGYTDVGARKYAPDLGRFISVDPVFEAGKPQELGGYTYAGSNPITNSDPSGLFLPGDVLGGVPAQDNQEDTAGGGGGKRINPSVTGGSNYDPDEVYPGIDVPMQWKGRAKFVRIFERYLDVSRNTDGTLPAYFYDGSNPQALSGQLGWYAQSTCYEMRTCSNALMAKFASMSMGYGEYIQAIGAGGPDGQGVGARLGAAGEVAGKDGEVAGGGGGGPCSFSPDTRVLLKGGKTKKIKKVKPGDQVEAADPETGKHRGTRRVTAHFVHHDDDLINLRIRSESGKVVTLHTTSLHPFWDDTEHAWVEAGKLTPGHDLNTVKDRHVVLVKVNVLAGSADMYNLTVEQLHTYYVLAGSTPVLVHNSGGTCPANLKSGNSAAAARGTRVHNGTEWGEHLDSLGYSRGHQISPGNIPDGFTADGFPVELKPNTKSGIKAGTRQLRRYMNEMGVDYGELWTYRDTQDGIVFDLVRAPNGSRRWTKW
ncbi:type IV secretion protein Rhs [Streptomyces sp. SID8366]|uniref:polymorphic toxin-type HINT domain-containing protein n=1 Tax=unclassified Streptomyces TaxID=2593676 RepID=UPI0011B9438D|nr:polymorphic toxin-type HINT domain-containing protein [Streptomyces sp. PsTaAH-130]MYU04264.1 type IV secretion protein Rhs [Streptomyces sp. SID8366]MYU61486.1 type IV secretion protein Rhs [Streptomyces sp. SID69]